MNPLNTVVVGYGFAGERIHVPLVRLAPQLRLHGVCSLDPGKRSKVQARFGCRTYATFDDAIADPSAELIVLATPNALHAAQAIAALSAGKHVVVDKPMCLTRTDAQRMIEAAQTAGRLLSVFHNRRFDSDYLTVRHLLETERLGELRWLELSWQRPGLPRDWKREASQGGGRLIDLGSHMIDQALLLIPAKVISVYCRTQHDFESFDIESHAMLTLGFADGRSAVIDTTSQTFAPKPRWRVLGTQGTFVKFGVDPQERALANGDIDAVAEDPADCGKLHRSDAVETIIPLAGRWRSYYEQVALALRAGDEALLPVRAAEAARVVAVLEAARESQLSGRLVVVDV